MENYEKFELLLRQHSFKELSAEEKLAVKDFVSSETEYEALRLANQKLNSYFSKQAEVSPGPQVWRRIKNTWKKSSTPVHHYHWIKAPMPVYATILLLISVGFLCWYGGSSYSATTLHVQQIKSHVDTVFIASKPDTVVKERIIYLETESHASTTLQVSNKNLPERPAPKGVTMKEKEELEKLLVSGSM